VIDGEEVPFGRREPASSHHSRTLRLRYACMRRCAFFLCALLENAYGRRLIGYQNESKWLVGFSRVIRKGTQPWAHEDNREKKVHRAKKTKVP
jgi:hypothetical protein